VSTGPIFLWLIGDWSKVPFNYQLRCTSKIAAILDLVSVDFLTYAWVDWCDFFCGFVLAATAVRFHLMMSAAATPIINFYHIPLLPKPYLPYTHRQIIV
jgi:hypothetical protein